MALMFSIEIEKRCVESWVGVWLRRLKLWFKGDFMRLSTLWMLFEDVVGDGGKLAVKCLVMDSRFGVAAISHSGMLLFAPNLQPSQGNSTSKNEQ